MSAPTPKPVRALLIDPHAKSISEVKVDPTRYGIMALIGGPCQVAYRYANGDVLYADADTTTGTAQFYDDNRSLFVRGKGVIAGTAFADAKTAVSDLQLGYQTVYRDPEPKYESRVNVGDLVFVSGQLTMLNSAGGTERIDLPTGTKVRLTRVWHDYEKAGYRCAGRIIDQEAVDRPKVKLTSKFGPDWHRQSKPDDVAGLQRAEEAVLNWKPDFAYFSERDAVFLAPVGHDNFDPDFPRLPEDCSARYRFEFQVQEILRDAVKVCSTVQDNDAETWFFTRAGQFVRITGVDQNRCYVWDKAAAAELLRGWVKDDVFARFFGPR